MVLVDSDRISHVPPYSGYFILHFNLQIQDYHHLWLCFPTHSLSLKYRWLKSYNPIVTEITMVWAFSISLAATQEITIVFSSSGYLDVSVLRVRLSDKSELYWVAPFGNLRINAYLAATRSLSQPITSFIAFGSLGIPRALLLLSFYLMFSNMLMISFSISLDRLSILTSYYSFFKFIFIIT